MNRTERVHEQALQIRDRVIPREGFSDALVRLSDMVVEYYAANDELTSHDLARSRATYDQRGQPFYSMSERGISDRRQLMVDRLERADKTLRMAVGL